MVGALGGCGVCGGVAVVHHGGDAVAHGCLVAPARETGAASGSGRWMTGSRVTLSGAPHSHLAQHWDLPETQESSPGTFCQADLSREP